MKDKKSPLLEILKNRLLLHKILKIPGSGIRNLECQKNHIPKPPQNIRIRLNLEFKFCFKASESRTY